MESLTFPGGGATDGGKVNVAIRVRPLIERERATDAQVYWQVGKNELRSLGGDKSAFAYDHVFAQDSKTKDVYDGVVAPIVNKAFEGFNGTILCYGQTSSGKTHTLYGSSEDKGIIQLFADHLFNRVEADQGKRSYLIKVGLLEIYNEKVTDMLNAEKPVELHEIQGCFTPTQLEEITVVNSIGIRHAADRIQRQRQVGETTMNKDSSRSHTILRVSIIVTENMELDLKSDTEQPPVTRGTTAVLHFVDLAGSEKQAQTKAEGERFREAVHINQSLSHLSHVISQLSEDSQLDAKRQESKIAGAVCTTTRAAPKQRIAKFINYRDSMLTKILKSTLSGDAYISMICNVTPASFDETKSTLNFAKQAKKIQIQPKQNLCIDTKDKEQLEELFKQKEEELKALKRQLQTVTAIAFDSSKFPAAHVASERRHSLCPTILSRPLKERQTFEFRIPQLPRSSYSCSSETFLPSEQVFSTSGQSFRSTTDVQDQEVQTDPEPVRTPTKKAFPKRNSMTPVQTLKISDSLLRVELENKDVEWKEQSDFLHHELLVLKEQLDEVNKAHSAEKKRLEDDLITQMESSDQRLKKQRLKLDQLEQLVDKIQKENMELKERTSDMGTSEKSHPSVSELEDQLNQLKQKLSLQNSAQESNKELVKSVEQLQQEKHEAVTRNNELVSQLQKKDEALAKYAEMVSKLEEKDETVLKSNDEMVLQLKEKDIELEQSKARMEELQRELKLLHEKISTKEEQSKLDELQEQYTKIMGENSELHKALQDTRVTVDNLVQSTQAHTAEKQRLEEELLSSEETVTKYRGEVDQLNELLVKTREELNEKVLEKSQEYGPSVSELKEQLNQLKERLSMQRKSNENLNVHQEFEKFKEEALLQLKLKDEALASQEEIISSLKKNDTASMETFQQLQERYEDVKNSYQQLQKEQEETLTQKAALEAKERAIDNRELTHLQEGLSHLRGKYEELTNSFEHLQKEKNEAVARCVEMLSQLNEKDEALAKYDEMLSKLEEKDEALSKYDEMVLQLKEKDEALFKYDEMVLQLKEKDIELEQSKAYAEERQQELMTEERQFKELQNKFTQLEGEYQELKARSLDLFAVLQEKDATLKKTKSTSKELQQELDCLKTQLSSKESVDEELRGQLQELIKANELLQKEKEMATEKSAEALSQLQEKEVEIASMGQRLNSGRDDKIRMDQSTQDDFTKDLVQELERRGAELEEQKGHLLQELDSLKENLDEAAKARDSERQQLQEDLIKLTEQFEQQMKQKLLEIEEVKALLEKSREEYKEKCSEIADKLLPSISDLEGQLNELKEQLSNEQKTKDELTKSLDQLEKEKAETETKNAELYTNWSVDVELLKQVKHALDLQHTRNAELAKHVQKLEADNHDMDERNAQTGLKFADLENTIVTLEQKLVDCRCATHKEDRSTQDDFTSDTIAQIRRSEEEWKLEAEEVKKELKSLRKQFDTARNRHAAEKTRFEGELAEQVKSSKETIDKLELQMKEIEILLEKTQVDLKEKTADISEKLQPSISKLEKQVNQLNAQLSNQQKSNDELAKTLDELQRAKDEDMAKNAELLSQLEEKESKIANLEQRLRNCRGDKIMVNRSTQDDFTTDIIQEFRRRGDAYKTRYFLVNKDLEKFQRSHKDTVISMEGEIKELKNTVELKDKRAEFMERQISKLTDVEKREDGVQCNLLKEQLESVNRGARVTLPDYIPNVTKLNEDNRNLKMRMDSMQLQINRCSCESAKKLKTVMFRQPGDSKAGKGPHKDHYIRPVNEAFARPNPYGRFTDPSKMLKPHQLPNQPIELGAVGRHWYEEKISIPEYKPSPRVDPEKKENIPVAAPIHAPPEMGSLHMENPQRKQQGSNANLEAPKSSGQHGSTASKPIEEDYMNDDEPMWLFVENLFKNKPANKK